MHILILHPENRHLGGAERMLEYFCAALPELNRRVTVAVAPKSRLQELLPKTIQMVEIPANGRFSLRGIGKGVARIVALHRRDPVDLIHGWAARDWELTAVLGTVLRRPVIGTLHDHPAATYISSGRQRLMRYSANLGLNRVVCVSDALKTACAQCGYAPSRLSVVHNGLPRRREQKPAIRSAKTRLGYLGVYQHAKGIDGLLLMLEELARQQSENWEMNFAGGTIDPLSEAWLRELSRNYGKQAWWNRVHWNGWVNDPYQFLNNIDVLIFPSRNFDSFPTVLLEAGLAGVPAVAARVGGTREIIEDGRTGWLFEPEAWSQGAKILHRLVRNPELIAQASQAARRRVETCFTSDKMIAEYVNTYSTVTSDV